MSFIYPRIVCCYRNANNTTLGEDGWEWVNESPVNIFTNKKASIQQRNTGRRAPTNFPGDTIVDGFYRIFIPNVLRGTIKEKDIIVDDLGDRYQVLSAYWNSLGYNVFADKLQN